MCTLLTSLDGSCSLQQVIPNLIHTVNNAIRAAREIFTRRSFYFENSVQRRAEVSWETTVKAGRSTDANVRLW